MNIVDYVKVSHETFNEKPFNEVDSLILCQLFYARLERVLDAENVSRMASGWKVKDFNRAEYYDIMFDDAISDEENHELFMYVVASRRFRNIKVKNIIAETSETEAKQFAACSFELGNGEEYVCFRGTDGTMLGWKEDFMMSYMEEVPAQRDAARYLDKFYGRMSRGSLKKIYIGGHSKGGNLALYAAIMAPPSIQRRILSVFSHDGPGFRENVIEKLKSRAGYDSLNINTTVPQASIVGMLMEGRDDYKIVASRSVSIGQHVAFAWEVNLDGNFVYQDQLTASSIFLDSTLREWLKKATNEQLELFVDTAFDILMKNGVSTVHELKNISATQIAGMYEMIKGLDPEIKAASDSLVKTLVQTILQAKMPTKPGVGRTLKDIKEFFGRIEKTDKSENSENIDAE